MSFGEMQLDEVVVQGSMDFEAWTTLISKVEQMYRDDIDKVSMVYDSFLSEFPLCYGYWKKYAEHKARLCGVENVVQIFERAVESAPYSVGVWLDYCNFGVSSFEDPFDVCRLFDRALSLIGKDYHCYKLWDKYIEYEFSHQHWNSLANIYIQTLKFPTKKLHEYCESFKKLVAIWEEEMQCQGISCAKLQSGYEINGEIKALEDAEIFSVISDLLDPSTRSKALLKYIYIGEQFYQRACELYRKVQKFEQNICRPYFHVKPLDDNQLHNWHRYLDLVEIEGDFDWAVNLYERCLISCANYPEFWMRYVDYMQSKGGREMATNALKRATCTFLKNAPEIHLFNAWFKEETGDVDGVRAAFQQCDQDFESYLIDIVRRKANMERRLGNYSAASNIYKEALDIAAEKRPDTLPMLYLHFARLQFMITSNVEATREVLLNGIQHVPHSKLLLKELIIFALMHEGAIEMETLDYIMAKALTDESDVSGSLSTKEREDISRLYLELIDFCGSIHDVRRAWKRHLKLFPHLLRVQPSLKKPAKAGIVWKMITDGRPGSFGTCPQNSMGKHGQNSEDKLLVEDNIDQSEQAIDGQAQFEGGSGSPNDLETMPSGVTKTLTEDACSRENELNDQAVHQAAADKSLLKVDSKSDGFQQEQDQDQEQEQKFQQLKPPSLDNPSLNSQGYEPPREASFSNRSIPASPRDTNVAERDNESPGPSSLPIHTRGHSDKEGNWRRLNPFGKGRSDVGSPGNSEERLESSLSPRRRTSHGYLDDRRHRERSLSPRRHGYRRHSEERWHRDRRHRRNFRYQDNSRGHRDNRMQNGNQVVVVGNNTFRTPNVQQQSTGFVPQTQLNVQPVAYSQGMNEQYGTGQNNQLYNQMWQSYYYNQQQQQQQSVQQQPPYQQQVQQMQSHQQLQQQMQNPSQPQHMQASQQIPAQQQQLLNLQYQQQMLYQQSQFQQQQQTTNEQPQSQDQQLQLQQLPQQQLYQQLPQLQQQQQVQIQQQQQPQVQQQEEVDLQKQQQQQQQAYQYQQLQQLQQPQVQIQQQQPQVQQEEVDLQKQQQQAYQYQQLQQQQYLLYLQQLQQYQHSQQQQPGVVKDQQSLQQQQQLPVKQEGLEKVRELQNRDDSSQSEPRQDDVSLQVDSRSSSHCQQGPAVECNRTSISCGVPSLPQSQDQLPEIEGTDI